MSDIPPDIIKPILARLPVKSLLRFRCVSKPWRSLIDSKDFINLHLHRSSKTNSNGAVLVDTNRLHYVDLDSFEKLDIGNPRIEPYSVLCSCNGLALVVSGFEDIFLWNPATRKQNKLPTPPSKSFEAYDFVQQRFAFGYDSKRDDYKVVRVIQAHSVVSYALLSSEVRIYSLKSNSWKKVKSLPFVVPPDRVWGVCLNDALHTVVQCCHNVEVIMAFDLGNEELYDVPMPPKSGKRRPGLSSVEVMGGFLTVVTPGKRNSSSSEIWVMKEYGEMDSWVKLLCFYPPISDPCSRLCPLAYSKKGNEVLLNYQGMCLNWYNLRKKSVTIACVNGLSASFNTGPYERPFRALFFVGSLVSPGGAAIGKPKGKGIKRKWDDMPGEIIKHVLSRLDVKSLLCLRCVSKSWCSWIDSKDFIQQHLYYSFKTKSNRTLLVDSRSSYLFCIDLESFKRLDIGTTQLENLVGCCNGLALVVSDWDKLVLWNPFTRKQNKLPLKQIDCPEPNEIYFALGYDSKNDDYKVVRVVQSCNEVDGVPLPLETMIYSLKTNSWRRIKKFPYLLSNDSRWGIYTNDALHSVVKGSHNSNAIMAFDIGKEKHHVVPIPEFNTKGRALSNVEVMEGFLAAVIYKEENNGEIWVMKEYGVKDSWMKLLCFEPPDRVYHISVCPLAYSKNNDEVLVNYDRICLTWYDFRNDSGPLTIECEDGLSLMMDAMALDPPFHVETCVASLVSPFSSAVVASEKHKGGQGKKETKKKRDDFLSVGFKLRL